MNFKKWKRKSSYLFQDTHRALGIKRGDKGAKDTIEHALHVAYYDGCEEEIDNALGGLSIAGSELNKARGLLQKLLKEVKTLRAKED